MTQAPATEDVLKGLMLLALDGDEAAYRHLLKALGKVLAGYYGRRLTGGAAADVDDLVQETLLAVHARRATYDRARPFTAWFFSIARYKLIDHLRGPGGRARLQVELDETLDSGFSEAALSARLDVERLLDTLPERQRQLIRDVRLEGQSIADTAARTGQSESAVKVGVHRALKALADTLRGET
ncbi:sigma-70 family RNA polymerase sigma factor [Rhizobium halophytocola]|uniref:RNA polymerase sigma-70 factor (ECF subfamily) n=1 Tax=Rhizobium halophytocola TaxID=735519 RepID=A0ABS4DWY0_9HYPH|nr:sigma-70 family RNA polymerase sigma factor [Rhizobium halophytocola]MBP1850144.1 RNA polymerase sigma-70 factor (ECF subfamily) [Rhizobium halophytocola]